HRRSLSVIGAGSHRAVVVVRIRLVVAMGAIPVIEQDAMHHFFLDASHSLFLLFLFDAVRCQVGILQLVLLLQILAYSPKLGAFLLLVLDQWPRLWIVLEEF